MRLVDTIGIQPEKILTSPDTINFINWTIMDEFMVNNIIRSEKSTITRTFRDGFFITGNFILRNIKFNRLTVHLRITNEENPIILICPPSQKKYNIEVDEYFIDWDIIELEETSSDDKATQIQNNLEFDEMLELFNISVNKVTNKIQKYFFERI